MDHTIGFDNEQYLAEQTKAILQRARENGNKLYLEFGGKLLQDLHAARVLPGYDSNVKMRLLQELKASAEIVLCIYAEDIARKKMRADFGISYESDTLKLISTLRKRGLEMSAVVITRFTGQPAAKLFQKRLEGHGIKVYCHPEIPGYPYDIETVLSEKGCGMKEFVETKRPIVVLAGPGSGSGKFATCLSQLYHEFKAGRMAGYAKFETFPVWNLSLSHPLNMAYEAATADLKDNNMVDPYHLQAYNKVAVNYNRDIEVFHLLCALWTRKKGAPCPYKSPTDMGVNCIASGIVDDGVVEAAAKQEIIRRYFRHLCEYSKGQIEYSTVTRAEEIMLRLSLEPEDRDVVRPAREAAQEAILRGKGRNGIYCGAAIKLRDGRIVKGKNSPELHAAASVVLNVIKVLAGIPDQFYLIAPDVVRNIVNMKKDILKGEHSSLNLDEALIGLAVSCTTNPTAQVAIERLIDLRNCEMHMTHIITPGDEAGLRRLGIHATSDPFFATAEMFIDE